MKNLLISLLIAIIFLTSCTSNNSNVVKFNDNQFDNDLLPNAKTGESGLTLGFYKHKGKIEPKRTFETNDSVFTNDIVFGNKMKNKGNFLLLIFDHAQQIKFSIDNKSVLTYKFSLSPNEFIRIPVKLVELSNGFHSINYIIVREPDLVITDPKRIAQADNLTQLFTVRINLLKNITSIPQPPPLSISNLSGNSRIHGVFLSKGKEDYNVWNNERASNNTSTDYTVHFGNNDKNTIRFYIVTLLDWNQVPFDGDTNYIYGELKFGEHGYKNAKLDFSLKNKTFISLMITNPFDALPDNSPYTIASMSSMRVKLN